MAGTRRVVERTRLEEVKERAKDRTLVLRRDDLQWALDELDRLVGLSVEGFEILSQVRPKDSEVQQLQMRLLNALRVLRPTAAEVLVQEWGEP